MIRVAGLGQQKSLRDLSGLPRLVDEVVWHDVSSLAQVDDPAVVVGLWLSEEPQQAKKLLAARSEAGHTTVVVPRFRGGDLRLLLNAPSAVKLKIGEYDAFQWDDDCGCEVPGQTVIETALHAGQWGAIAGLGVTVLAFRPHEGAGWIVLCTAGVTSRRFGVDVQAQRGLLSKIIKRAAASAPVKPGSSQTVDVGVAETVEDLLTVGDANVPAILLALALVNGTRDVRLVADTLKRVGFDLSDETVEQVLKRVPCQGIDELVSDLRKYGWSAHLRRSRAILAEGGIE